MITQIEKALIDRLTRGLGKMVVNVASYAGELDDAQLAVKRLPAVLISYAGAKSEAKGMAGRGARHLTTDTFVALVMVSSLRTDETARYGDRERVGANALIGAVKYLLTNQTLGGLVSPIRPTRVQTVLNNAEVLREKLTAYAVEFEMTHNEPVALADGKFPVGSDDPNEREYIFKRYRGELSEADPDLLHLHSQIIDPTTGAKVPSHLIFNGEDK